MVVVAQQDGLDAPQNLPDRTDLTDHRTTTVEQGPFCSARCSCGWRGPARRARSLARTDARAHAGT
ncbi:MULTISPECIES: hypothetical protein [Streptomyces]|uniref:Uncharacterized protein n=2 Tax=Streptomyces TaxID=1883 RepID=A0A918GSU8_STRGD|nr:hypothetical protein GCM10010238_54230 [Streptomyces niveoruber]GGT10995.1 hypothetical protein GCM10010240_50440 [Streptomyces griseoviridis]GGU55331.1 hypothetical protein GCM10010259_53220 [Streptomyces daghestanicus]GHI32357.1 hypothetical protein Sdagh_40870 [Streptomyces daghestanicus]